MERVAIVLWREVAPQFLLTFSVLSAVGFGMWAVGAGWSYLRRHRHRPSLTPVDAPMHRGQSPTGTIIQPPGLYPNDGEARDRRGMTKSPPRATGGQI